MSAPSKAERGHLRLKLRGGETTAAVELDLVGTARIYLGAYDIETGEYHGSIDAGRELLRWLEAAARRVRAQRDRAKSVTAKPTRKPRARARRK